MTGVGFPGLSVPCVSLGAMEMMPDMLLFQAVHGWCHECGDERILVPAVEEGLPGGDLCCTSCDAAVFGISLHLPERPLRRTA